MEVKLSQRHCLLTRPNFLLQNPSNTHAHSICLKSWVETKGSFTKHFKGLTERWRFHVQESKVQHSTQQFLVHVVKEGETLTTISKQYGVPIYSIVAANNDIVNVDLVFEGQCLNIPPASEETLVNKMSGLRIFDPRKKLQASMSILDGLFKQRAFITLTSYNLPHAKSTGYFLVLVPLIAFCIRCIIDAFQSRVAGGLGHQFSNESRRHCQMPKSMRWKSALSDIREPDSLDSELKPDSHNHAEDEEQVSFEEMSNDYSKLEHDYQKFLSECGMSKWGYWRGGSHE